MLIEDDAIFDKDFQDQLTVSYMVMTLKQIGGKVFQ